MKSIIQIGQLVVAIIIIALTLLQEGGGLSSVFGGSESRSFHVRRGLERMIFISTILAVIIFVGLSIANLVL